MKSFMYDYNVSDTSSPVGVLEFSVGVRTADSLQVTWVEPPVSSANDLVTGYKLLVSVHCT